MFKQLKLLRSLAVCRCNRSVDVSKSGAVRSKGFSMSQSLRSVNTNSPSTKSGHVFTITVEGNIASGKTTFLNQFAEDVNSVFLVTEPVEKWRNLHGYNLLDLMYKDPKRWSLALQSYIQLTMLDMHCMKPTKSLPVKMMERSIYSARYCFVENLYKSGNLPAPEYAVLAEWYSWLEKNMDIGVDLIVYLRTEPEVVYERLKARARSEELTVSLDYLHMLNKIHEDWLFHKTSFPVPAQVLVIDANQDLLHMEEVYRSNRHQILNGTLNKANKTVIDKTEEALQ